MDDLGLLVDHFLQKFSKSLGKEGVIVTPEAMRLLVKLPWDGNIRELENTIERAAILCNNNIIEPEDVQPDSIDEEAQAVWSQEMDISKFVPESAGLNYVLYLIEKKMLVQALEDTNHVQARAAEKLGITKSLLQYKMKKYKIKKKK